MQPTSIAVIGAGYGREIAYLASERRFVWIVAAIALVLFLALAFLWFAWQLEVPDLGPTFIENHDGKTPPTAERR